MDCKTIFNAMPERFNPEGAGDWAADIQFNVAGDRGGDFIIKIADGACTVSEGVDEGASSTIMTDDETWIGIVEGSVNPMTAFMTGKIKVGGNMAKVMMSQNLINEFARVSSEMDIEF